MTLKSPDRGLYLHIPFCHARCGYCDFVTFTGKEDRVARYVEQLKHELTLHTPGESSPLHTVFFGGGTPSLLEPEQTASLISHIRERFILDACAEITLEANPESVTLEKARGWLASGINRVSMGLQAFDDRLLKAADRLHTVADFVRAYETLRAAGFSNLSVDLIYGLPGQTLADWQDSLDRTVALEPEHLSLYALKIESHTPFASQGITVNDDLQADMYEYAMSTLPARGLAQYEVSNFSRPGFECRHNLIYWRQGEYYGVGVGAVGCVGGKRWENVKNFHDYDRALEAGLLPRLSQETLSEEARRLEHLMLGLRLREGLVWEESNPVRAQERERLREKRLLEQLPDGRWRVPDAAILLTHQVLLPFVG